MQAASSNLQIQKLSDRETRLDSELLYRRARLPVQLFCACARFCHLVLVDRAAVGGGVDPRAHPDPRPRHARVFPGARALVRADRVDTLRAGMAPAAQQATQSERPKTSVGMRPSVDGQSTQKPTLLRVDGTMNNDKICTGGRGGASVGYNYCRACVRTVTVLPSPPQVCSLVTTDNSQIGKRLTRGASRAPPEGCTRRCPRLPPASPCTPATPPPSQFAWSRWRERRASPPACRVEFMQGVCGRGWTRTAVLFEHTTEKHLSERNGW